MSNRARYSGGGDGEAFVMLVVMALILVFFLVTRAANTVRTAFAKQPHNKALWAALLVWVVSVVSLLLAALAASEAGASAGASSVVVVLGVGVAVTTLLLLIVCRSVTVMSQQLVSPPKEQLATRVLHRPWWTPPDDVA